MGGVWLYETMTNAIIHCNGQLILNSNDNILTKTLNKLINNNHYNSNSNFKMQINIEISRRTINYLNILIKNNKN